MQIRLRIEINEGTGGLNFNSDITSALRSVSLPPINYFARRWSDYWRRVERGIMRWAENGEEAGCNVYKQSVSILLRLMVGLPLLKPHEAHTCLVRINLFLWFVFFRYRFSVRLYPLTNSRSTHIPRLIQCPDQLLDFLFLSRSNVTPIRDYGIFSIYLILETRIVQV